MSSRTAAPALIRAVIVVLALNAGFLALAVWTATRPRDPLIARVREAFASGELVDKDYLPLDSWHGVHQYNDCLILQMITNSDRHIWLNAVAPLFYIDTGETSAGGADLVDKPVPLADDLGDNQCATLHGLVEGRAMSRYQPYRYARYWHGYNTVAAALLERWSLNDVRRGLKLAVYGSLALLLFAAGVRHRGLLAVVTAIAVTGASVWAVPYFGQSLNDGPGDALALLGIGSFLFWRRHLADLARFIPFCAAFGAGMAYIEMFTGATLVAAGLLFPIAYVVAVSEPQGTSARQGWLVAVAGLVAFVLGSAFTIAIRLALSIAFLGHDAAGTFLGRLKDHMSSRLTGRPSITAPFGALLRQGSVLTYGNETAALLLYAVAGLAWLTAVYLALRRAGARRLSDLLAFAVGAASLPLWVVLFPTHTVIHGWLNVRLLFVPISLGLAALVWQLTTAHVGEEGRDAERASQEGRGRCRSTAAGSAAVMDTLARDTRLGARPLIAFFDYPDVFEDFYPHYGVDQRAFATRWVGTGSHAFLSLLQREVGDVVWYAFSLAPEIEEARHEAVGCQVKMLRSSWLHRRLWRAFYLPRMAWRWRRAYPVYATVASYAALASWGFIRTLERHRPDVIFVQDYATGRYDTLVVIARALGVPLIAYHSGSRPEHYIGRLAKRWTIPAADRLIVSSQEELEMLVRRYRVARERLALILTPIDTTGFRPRDRNEACRAAGLDPTRRYVLFVGRLDDRVKRVSSLIRSFGTLAAEHTHADLVIVGDGPDGAELRRLAEIHASGRVRFAGWVAGVEPLAAFYNAAECLVLPSLSEGFPTVVGEAMACGVPVLASRVGGVSELVIEGETGWTLRPGDDDGLRARLAFVLAHPEAVASMRPRARRIAEERVSPGVVAAQLRECFAGAMKGP